MANLEYGAIFGCDFFFYKEVAPILCIDKDNFKTITIVGNGGSGGVLKTKNFVENVTIKGRVNFGPLLFFENKAPY